MSLLRDLWWSGVDAVAGRAAVANSLRAQPCPVTDVVAVGKAASAMCLGAFDALSHPCRALVVTKAGHIDAELAALAEVQLIEAGHPIPDANSLVAGDAIRERVREADQLLLLVSGGASALAELLVDGVELDDLMMMTDQLLAQGADIVQINAQRTKQSLIKGGLLLQEFAGRQVTVLAISDVPDDAIEVIGSGIGATHRVQQSHSQIAAFSRIIASNHLARRAIEERAQQKGIEVRSNSAALHAPMPDLVMQLVDQLVAGPPGLYIWGGEPTLELPSAPGVGGRNQSLALALWAELGSRRLAQRARHEQSSATASVAHGVTFDLLVGGTDGTDGPTEAAGGELTLDDGVTSEQVSAASLAVERADAGSHLAAGGNLLVSGPTGTNVMDIALCLKHSF